ncbi:MAG: hypothetical protein PHN45_00205 [Methylococcales bacterium]|nr:hypothetical protein [Methylococcales bacterium]
MAAEVSAVIPKTKMENMFTSAFDATGATKALGSFMMMRTKLIVIGIVSALIMFGGMVVASTMATKIKRAQKAGGCNDQDDLDKAYMWGWTSALAYGIFMTLFGGMSIALIVSMFL